MGRASEETLPTLGGQGQALNHYKGKKTYDIIGFFYEPTMISKLWDVGSTPEFTNQIALLIQARQLFDLLNPTIIWQVIIAKEVDSHRANVSNTCSS